MKYRVYIKQARKDLLENVQIYAGKINGDGTVDGTSKAYIITGFIPIKQTKRYQLMELGYDVYDYAIFEYESNQSRYAIDDSYQEIHVTSDNYFQYYTPKKSNANYIKLMISGNSRNYRSGSSQQQNRNLLKKRIASFMFLESAEAVLIHDSGSPNKKDHLVNVNLELSDSQPGSLEFTLYKDHPYYQNGINLWTDTLYITRTYKNDGAEHIIWDGRPINKQEDSYGNIACYCEGALGYFNDLRVIPTKNHNPKIDVQTFILDYIVDYQNSNSILSNRMDRSFFGDKIATTKNGVTKTEYVITRDIDIDPGYKNEWSTNYESALQWLNDITESYGGHMKIVYSYNNTPQDEIICRKLVMVQDFDKKTRIRHYKEMDEPYSIYNKNRFKKYLPKDTLYYFSSLRSIHVYRTKVNFYYESQSQLNPNSAVYIGDSYIDRTYFNVSNLDHTDLSEKTVSNPRLVYAPKEYYNYVDQNGTEHESITDLNQDLKYYYLVFKPNGYERFSRIRVNFGLDMFEASKTSEIGDVATRIVPRGMECSDTSGESTNIFMTTTEAFVDGDYKYNGIRGLRHFGETSGLPSWLSGYGDYLEDPALIKIYGLVEAVVDFESAETPLSLWNMGNKWLRDLRKDLIRTSIETSLTDFGQVEVPDEYKRDPHWFLYTDREYVDIWTQIYAKIPELGIGTDDPEEHYYVTSMSIPLDDHLNTRITLANNAKMITDNIISAGDIKGTSKGIIDKSQ